MWTRFMRLAEITARVAPERVMIAGYASYMALGALLLSLPVSQRDGAAPSFLDNLFTSVSAVSTTGLATVSTSGSYSFFGQFVILWLIQLGGLGYMTLGSFVALSVSGRMSALQRNVVQGSVFSLPQGLEIGKFVKSLVLFTFGIELVGALLLYPFFCRHGVAAPAWQAAFHSVSAFCTAGFSLSDSSFESFRTDTGVNLVLIALSYLGAIGFIVMSDFYDWITGRKKGVTLTTKIILWSTFVISAFGTLLFAMDEPLVASLPLGDRILTSWFQVMTASTTVGFNTVPIGSLSASSLFLLTVVMVVGASPSGTGGGLKTTSVSALWAVMLSVVRRGKKTAFAGREIPEARVRTATASLMFYLVALLAGIYFVALFEKLPLQDLMFECASALGTVGLSRGVTGSLDETGKLLIIALMFLGRVGPLSIGMALFSSRSEKSKPVEDLAV